MIVGLGESAFRLEVEQAHAGGVIGGAVIVGRFVEGSIEVGAQLEVLGLDGGRLGEPVLVTCEDYSMLCEVGWSPAKGVLLAVIVRGVDAGQVRAGSILRAVAD